MKPKKNKKIQKQKYEIGQNIKKVKMVNEKQGNYETDLLLFYYEQIEFPTYITINSR